MRSRWLGKLPKEDLLQPDQLHRCFKFANHLNYTIQLWPPPYEYAVQKAILTSLLSRDTNILRIEGMCRVPKGFF